MKKGKTNWKLLILVAVTALCIAAFIKVYPDYAAARDAKKKRASEEKFNKELENKRKRIAMLESKHESAYDQLKKARQRLNSAEGRAAVYEATMELERAIKKQEQASNELARVRGW